MAIKTPRPPPAAMPPAATTTTTSAMRRQALARARHTHEWTTIAAEAALTLLRKRSRPRPRARAPPRRIRGRTTVDEPLLWALARRYNTAHAHARGLCPSLRLWQAGGLQLQLGTVYWGLRHILRRHGANFGAVCGVPEAQVCELVRWHVAGGRQVFADQRSRWYELVLGDGGGAVRGMYLCVIHAPSAVGEGAGAVLSAYPATQKRLYMERRRNRSLKRVPEVAHPHGLAQVEPITWVSRLAKASGTPESKPGVTGPVPEPAPGLTEPAPAIITPGPEATTTPETTTAPKKRFKIKRIWHAFSTPQVRRLFLTDNEVDSLPGTTHERSLRRRSGKSVHATAAPPPTIIVPPPLPTPKPPQHLRIHRHPEQKRPQSLAHRVLVRPYAPKPRIHRTRAPPYRPRPRITKFTTRRRTVARCIRGRPFVRVNRTNQLRRPAARRAQERRRRERWSVTRGTPGDVLAVLGALVRARRGQAAADGRGARAGVLGLLGHGKGKAFPRLGGGGGGVRVRRTGAFMSPPLLPPPMLQVRPLHTGVGLCPRRMVGTGVLAALWRFAGRRFV